MCESLFCTVAVIAPVVLAVILYRKDVRELLKILFVIFLFLGACLTFRHTFFRLIYRVRTYLRRRRPQEYEGECTHRIPSFSTVCLRENNWCPGPYLLNIISNNLYRMVVEDPTVLYFLSCKTCKKVVWEDNAHAPWCSINSLVAELSEVSIMKIYHRLRS